MSGNGDGLSPTPSLWSGNPDRPVERIAWNDLQVFLGRLNAAEMAAGRLPDRWEYALPTEAQWEYACRAGTTTAYYWGDDINSSHANYNWDAEHNTGIDFKRTRNVGRYPANPWGFYDMLGNVEEWTNDRYASSYPTGNVSDPEGPGSGTTDRVKRGGAWNTSAPDMRSGQTKLQQSYRSGKLFSRFPSGRLKNTNHVPSGLNSISPLAIVENQPIGTFVGEFNATDPDAGATLTYHLVSGAGDTHNTLFTLETNGTLKTATTFDYESNASTYSIRVQTKDEFNASVEGNFTVTLINANEPSTGSVTVSGTPVVGQTLTASNTLADPDGFGAITYQWYRDGVPIVLGDAIKNGLNGVNGLDGSNCMSISLDGKHAYVTAST